MKRNSAATRQARIFRSFRRIKRAPSNPIISSCSLGTSDRASFNVRKLSSVRGGNCCFPYRRSKLSRGETPAGRMLIFVPTYNERDNVEGMLRQILALDLDADVVFVDDNSPDG